jgi:hypothetical protein
VLITLALPFLVLGIGGAVAAVVVRFRRAGEVERAQLKWFAFAVALTPLPFIAHDAAPASLTRCSPSELVDVYRIGWADTSAAQQPGEAAHAE